MLYEYPIMEVLRFETKEVVCASLGDPNNPTFDIGDASGDWDEE